MKCRGLLTAALALCAWSAWAVEELDLTAPEAKFHIHDAVNREQAVERTVAPDGTPALKARWNSDKAGWMEFNANPTLLLPEFTRGTLTLEVFVSDGSRIRGLNGRLTDAEGETFQLPLPVNELKPGWNTVAVTVDTGRKYNAWGGKSNNKQIDFPVRFSGCSIDFAGKNGSGELYFKKAVFLTEPEPGKINVVKTERFTSSADWRGEFYEGNGSVDFSPDGALVRLQGKAMALFPRRLEPVHSGVSAVTIDAELLTGAAEVRFFFSDADGKEFRADWRKLQPGHNEIRFSTTGLLAGAGEPLIFHGVSLRGTSGTVVRFAEVRLDEVQSKLEAIRVEVRRDCAVNLTEDGNSTLEVENTGGEPVFLDLHLTFADHLDAVVGELTQALEIAPNTVISLPLPPMAKFGIRYAAGELRDRSALDGPGRRIEFRQVRMIPAKPSAERSEGFLFGVCAHPQRYSEAAQRREAETAMLAGAKVLRTDALWGKIQPNREEWDYSSLDRVVELFGAQGIELELIYSFTPKWAVAADWKPLSPDPARATRAPRPDYEYWREFVRRTAGRYQGKIRFFEVWNEPDLFSFANFSAEEYLVMLRIAAKETRAVNSGAVVLTGGYTCMPPFSALNDQKHQEKILSQAKDSYDVHAFHGHGPFPHYFPQIERMKVMRENLQVTAPWWANETADNSVFTGEYGQAVTLWKKLFYSWANGSIGYNWYDLRNDGYDPRNVEHNFGMVTHDFQPKAVYPAYNTITRNFHDARYLDTVTLFPEARLYRFQRAGAMLAAGWNERPEVQTRLLAFSVEPGAVGEAIDLFDNRSALVNVDGVLFAPFGNTPQALAVTGARLEPLGELFQVSESPTLSPGGSGKLLLRLTNVFAQPLPVKLALRLPEEVTADYPAELTLAPREERTVSIGLHAGAGYLADQVAIGLRVTLPQGVQAESLIPVQPLLTLRSEEQPAPDFSLADERQLQILVPADPSKEHLFWRGVADLSARGWLTAVDRKLKLRLEVTDDRHVQPYRNDEVWKGDNVQLAFRIPAHRGLWVIGLTRLADGSPQVWVWETPDGVSRESVIPQVQLQTERDDASGKTYYTAEIPYEAIGAEDGMRFNVLVNDNDGEERESFLQLTPGLGDERKPDRYFILRGL